MSLDRHEKKAVPPSVSDLKPWLPRDYSSTTQQIRDSVKFSEKAFFYDSSLTNHGKIYTMPFVKACYPPQYYTRNLRFEFEGEDPGVPGSFQYDQPWRCWGGDERYGVGADKYTANIGHFGHSHIFTTMCKINTLRANPKASVGVENLMSEHLLNGSTQIFNWSGNVVDTEGNKVPYKLGTPQGDVHGMFDMFINGTGTQDGVIDVDYLLSSLQGLKDNYLPKSAQLQVTIDRLAIFLDDILLHGKIPLMSWRASMTHHQHLIFTVWQSFYKLYRTRKCSKKYKRRLIENEMMCRQLYDTAAHMGGFFGTFYSVISFLDTLLYEMGWSKDTAIPNKYRNQRETIVHVTQKRYWREHVTMFSDYDKAAALIENEETELRMYQIQVAISESCTTMEIYVGAIFSALDKLVRHIGLFKVLPDFYSKR